MERLVHRGKTVQFLGVLLEHFALYQFIAIRPLVGLNREHLLNDRPDVVRVVVGDLRVDTLANTFVQMVHVPAPERRLEREHLVDDAAERPDI